MIFLAKYPQTENSELVEEQPTTQTYIEVVQQATEKKQIDTENILFIGNSLTSGIDSVTDKHEFIYKNGATIKYLRTNNYYDKISSTTANTIVICLGTNELGWFGEKNFKNEFNILIDTLNNIKNNPDIIILTIPPVTEEKSMNEEYFNNSNVEIYNNYLKDIAIQYELNIIYSNELFGNVLADKLSYDGIHLNGTGYNMWYEFIISKIAEFNELS